MRCCKEWAFYGFGVVPSLDVGGGVRLREGEGGVTCGAFVLPAKLLSQPSVDESCKSSTGWRLSQWQWCHRGTDVPW